MRWLRIAVAEVEAEAAARVLRSPADAIYKSEVEGEYQYHLNLAVASPLLDITEPSMRVWQVQNGELTSLY